MKILVVGSGGREHAIGWKIAQSRRVEQLYFAPGNPGTADLGENLAVSSDDIPGLVKAAQEQGIDLVVVGPEVPLTLGLVDALRAVGISAFGPTRAAAQMEGSKVFAKDFMDRHAIPSARYACFTDFQQAVEYLQTTPGEIVIKASGLAAGKGVILPESEQEARRCGVRYAGQAEFWRSRADDRDRRTPGRRGSIAPGFFRWDHGKSHAAGARP